MSAHSSLFGGLGRHDLTQFNVRDFFSRSYYPNYLAFFHRIISAPPAASSPYADKPTSVVPVVEQYLFGGEGQMLVRAVSGALHPLIHIGHGIEFGLDGHVAEGQSPVSSPFFSAPALHGAIGGHTCASGQRELPF